MTTTKLNGMERSQLNEILYLALIEILGEKQTQDLLGQDASHLISLSNLHEKLIKTFGCSSSKGIEHRVGQSCFRHFLKRMGSEMGFFQSAFKLFPIKKKILTGFHTMSEVYGRNFNDRIQFTDSGVTYQLKVGNDQSLPVQPLCNGCDLMTGFIKEFMAWVGNGKVYEVNECECRMEGYGYCIFNIGKVPLD